MIGLNTSILVAHAIAEHPQHEASQRCDYFGDSGGVYSYRDGWAAF